MRATHSVNEGFAEEFCRKDKSGKRSGPFNESPDSESEFSELITFPKLSFELILMLLLFAAPFCHRGMAANTPFLRH